MWLINTTTLELKYFIFNDEMPRYTVLSHTWEDEELTFQEWNTITKQSDSAEANVLKKKQGYRKIQQFCRVSRCHNFCLHWERCTVDQGCQYKPTPDISEKTSCEDSDRHCCTFHQDAVQRQRARSGPCKCGGVTGIYWAWADTVCIDKSSSVELQEHILSMFRIYQKAIACFAYLGDIDGLPGRDNLAASKWFTRGWTLQELLAPKNVHFLRKDWQELGVRSSYSHIIEQRTGVPKNTVDFGLTYPVTVEEAMVHSGQNINVVDERKETPYHWRPSIYSTSAAQIFSWVSRRRTSRAEDIAYCLLGMLNVHIPSLYGEGATKAFRRLQEAVLRETNDYSVFAWKAGLCHSDFQIAYGPVGVLAPEASYFADCGDVVRDLHGSIGSRFVNERLAASFSVPAQLNTRIVTLRVYTCHRKIEPWNGVGGDRYRLIVLNCYKIGHSAKLLCIAVQEHTRGFYIRIKPRELYTRGWQEINLPRRLWKMCGRDIVEDVVLITETDENFFRKLHK